ncbi:MAG: CehA/McbA family metallohydrolase [Deltaproteobacteria bacterium]|jgi:hypothetical protein|nr:CehA/McbA family metallohydrolase [Deltaproteobacteria bacterium]
MELIETITNNVSPTQARSHIYHKIELQRDYQTIEIRFFYDPWQAAEEDLTQDQRDLIYPKLSLTQERLKAGQGSPISPELRPEANFPISMELRNVLTLAVEDGFGLRGIPHQHSPSQTLRLGVKADVTAGLSPGLIPKGPLTVTVNVFSVWGKGCQYRLEIYGTVLGATPCLPFELHSHTLHSDGTQTASQIAEQARQLGYRGLALTDHNTTSGQGECLSAATKRDLVFVNGLEWTTFFGHVLILNPADFPDWRGLGLGDLESRLRTVRKNNPQALIGIAHPFIAGTIGCSGCGFEYPLKDWSLIDYLEVLSAPHLRNHERNDQAFKLWTDLLNMGVPMTAVAGGDWHQPLRRGQPLGATYVLGERDHLETKRFLSRLGRGQAAVSTGPVPIITVIERGAERSWGVGEWLPTDSPPKEVHAMVEVKPGSVKGDHINLLPDDEVLAQSDRGILWRKTGAALAALAAEAAEATEGGFDLPLTARVPLPDGSGFSWLRALIKNGQGRLIAFSNVIYGPLFLKN